MPLHVKIVMTVILLWVFGLAAALILDVVEVGSRWVRRVVGFYLVYVSVGGTAAIFLWVAALFLVVIWGGE